MCGRFTLHANMNLLLSQFAQEAGLVPDWMPRFNIAPSQSVPVIRDGKLTMLRWGLIPSWAKEAKIGYSMINARADTVATKPAFRKAFESRRCLIPADGFYEWQKLGKVKQPYFFHRPDDSLFAFAGLWESNREFGESCSLVTTTANGVVSVAHDRMPVVLDRSDWQAWVSPSSSKAQLEGLLRPAADDYLVATPVSQFVNNPKNEGAGCIEPLAK